jgi:hypothetical protein
MTQFPVHVYKSPGNYVTVGKRYKLNSVADQESLDAHLANGWHLTLQAAFDAAGDAANVVKRSADWKTVKKRKSAQRKAFKAARAAANKPKAEPVEPIVSVSVEVPEDDAPPTRAELEQQATLLGVKFDGRTTDKRLLERINEAMKGA